MLFRPESAGSFFLFQLQVDSLEESGGSKAMCTAEKEKNHKTANGKHLHNTGSSARLEPTPEEFLLGMVTYCA